MRITFRFFFAFALLVIASSTVRSQDIDESGRAHIFEFLNVATSPRAAAMGNTFVAMRNDPNTLFYNPGALGTITKDTNGFDQFVSFGFSKYVLDINEGYISFAETAPESLGDSATIAAGVQYINYGSFDGYDTKGVSTGSFGASDLALSLAYSNKAYDIIHYGVGVKFIQSNLVSGSSVENYSAKGIAADFGLFYDYQKALMTFGLSVLNVGTELKTYAGQKEALPVNVQLGVSKRLERLPLTLHLAFRNLTRDREGRNIFYAFNDFSLGGEFVMGKVVRLRFGYENQKRRDLKTPSGSGLAGFSGGFGLVIKRYQIDYGFSSQGPAFSALHRIGASIAF